MTGPAPAVILRIAMKYCPKCRSEFSYEDAKTCPECGSTLVGTAAEMETFGSKLLFDAKTRADAEYLVAALSTNDIKSRIDEKQYFGAGPHVVAVGNEDFDRATAILDETGLADETADADSEQAEESCSCAPSGELITVAKFESAIAANELKTHLEMNGIPAFIENEHATHVLPMGSAIGPILVKVPASHIPRAAALLNLEQNPSGETGRTGKKYGCGIMAIVFIFFAVPIAAALYFVFGLNPIIAAIIAAVVAAGGVSLIFAEPTKDEFEDEKTSEENIDTPSKRNDEEK